MEYRTYRCADPHAPPREVDPSTAAMSSSLEVAIAKPVLLQQPRSGQPVTT